MKTGLTLLNKRLGIGGGICLLLALVLIFSIAIPVLGVQLMPHTFRGQLTICGTPAPAGTTISARIAGVQYGTGDVDATGNYQFIVLGDDPQTAAVKEGGVNGDLVEFFALGKLAGTALFLSLDLTDLDLQVALLDLTVTSTGCCPITVGELGTVQAGATDTFVDIACGTDVVLTAEESTCCVFIGWEVDGTPVDGNPITVNMDNFHTAVATCELPDYTLTTIADPAGGGTVTGGGTNPCGTEVPVGATANQDYYFDHWSGDLAGNANPTSIVLDGNKTVTANFLPTGEFYTLTVNIVGSGTVTKVPDEATYDPGDVVQLTAVPDGGWEFAGWSGDLGGLANPENITMNSNKTVTATFVPTGDVYTLTINILGGGTVTRNPDQLTYELGDIVQLTATPDDGWLFGGWSGDLTGTTNPVNITMNSNKTVTANFAAWITELGAGWNTLSTPITLDAAYNTWGEFKDFAGLDTELAYWYDGTFHIVGDTYPFEPCDAILVKLTSPGVAPFVPSSAVTAPPSRNLGAGWSLIGSAFMNETGAWPVDQALTSIYYTPGELTPWGYTQVISPPYNLVYQPSWVCPRPGEGVGTAETMLIGKGYWTWMLNAGEYAGQTVTPWNPIP